MSTPHDVSGAPPALAAALRQLAGLQPLDLPTDFPRPAVLSRRTAALPFRLAAAAARLRQLAAAEGAGLPTLLLVLVAATLFRLTGQDEVAIGAFLEGGADPLILRLKVSGEEGFAALLRQATAVVRNAFGQVGAPFAQLADAVDPGRDASRHPVFQVALHTAAPASASDAADTPLSTAALDLDFRLDPAAAAAGEIRGELFYAADLFAPATMARLLEAKLSLADAAAQDPLRSLARLPLLPADEERKLRAGHGSRPLAVPEDLLLHETFFRQAAATPDKIALHAGGSTLSFAEAAALASRVAWALRGRGAGPETRVGVFLERGRWLVPTLIGTLAADAAYVPLDPEYPAERIGFTLEDAGARLIVTQRSLADRLAAHPDAEILLIEEIAASAGLAETPPPRRAGQLNLAYLIYTSGSTGRPKGVAIAHRSAVAFLEWTKHVFAEREMACVLFSTSICFDISIFEMFATLQRGGKVVVVKNAFELPTLDCREELTLIDTVPSVTRELLRDGHLPSSVETVNLAGEALPQDLVDRCWQEPGVARVYNFYGPSEDTTFSTYEMCEPGQPPTIGHLIEGSRGFVADRNFELLPLGFPGELFLAGEGLSRGYLGRPRLTAERYLPDPFSGVPGGRMYRTGDLIRHREDGGFHFCGRLDHQVKVRGYRVELGEIEMALRDHPAVAQAVVVARGDGPGGQRLVSYVVLHPELAGTAGEELRELLALRLPNFMVPAATVILGAFPLTPNGKIDRKLLPSPEAAGQGRRAYRAPATPAESALAAIWGELLRRDQIGADDDFFVLGGDSILVIQVVSRAYAAGWDLEPRELFEHTTLAAAAAVARPVAPDGHEADESRLADDELAEAMADLEGLF